MMLNLLSSLKLALIVIIMNAMSVPATAEVKALIIGSDYSSSGNPRLELQNPVADVRMIRSALRGTAIEEMLVLEEPSAEEWEEGLNQYLDSLTGDDVGLFYFAGHGFQIEGQNYLMSSDGKMLIPLDSLISQIGDRARGAVVIIDACRNNPLVDLDPEDQVQVVAIEGSTRSLTRVSMDTILYSPNGLAQLSNLRGLSAVAFFSTEPGNVAEDGATPGKGSPFAKEIVRQLKRRQSLDEVFRKTAVAVNARTEGRQSPWRQGDLPFDVFLAGMRALPIP
jgi:uncharacterized caspase-like protein